MTRFVLLFCFFAISAHTSFGQILQSEKDSVEVPVPGGQDPEKITAFKPQRYLVLDKPGKVKRLRFLVGQEITFRLKNDPIMYSDVITAIEDSSFTIFGTRVPLREVDRVVVHSQNWFVNVGSVLLPAAGVIYFVADNINPVIQGRDGFSVSRGSVVVGASLLIPGIILKAFQKRSHKIGKNKRLRIFETF